MTTETLTQFVRGYVAASEFESKKSTRRTPGSRQERFGLPWDGYVFTFDTETTVDHRQVLRFGFYRINGAPPWIRKRFAAQYAATYHHAIGSGDAKTVAAIAERYRTLCDALIEEGAFYNAAEMSPDEIALLSRYIEKLNQKVAHPVKLYLLEADQAVKAAYRERRGKLKREPQDFIDLFYRWVFDYGALDVTLNSPFDHSRLACGWRPARGFYRGGFTLTLCHCEHQPCFSHPPIRIKHTGPHKQFTAFQHGRYAKQSKRSSESLNGRFLDLATLGGALLGARANVSLKGLGRYFDIRHKKLDTDEHGGPLTIRYLAYARRDVLATHEVYQAERDLYAKHGLTTPMWRIQSEAGIGKAYFADMGITPPGDRLKVPDDVLGHTMAALYAGRSEVRIRHQPTEVEYCDFKSQYPTVCSLMRLQDFLLATSVTVDDATVDVLALLGSFTVDTLLDWLQQPDHWPLLLVICRVRPHGDRLPIRADYGPDGRNLGLPLIEDGPDCYWTLYEVLASFSLTGKAPQVVEAFRFTPHGRIKTQPKAFFGDVAYTMDPAKDDIFVRMVDLRTQAKHELKSATRDGREQDAIRLDGIQQAIKPTVNSTSYGINIEVSEAHYAKAQTVMVHGLSSFAACTTRIESPGKYFFAPSGVLIPAGGRLLLAIAETLANREGLGYAFMDTDSIALARPDEMPQQEFYERCERVRSWFTPLSPYAGQPPILEQEDENEWEGERTPLYFLGVSAKRYVLYNRLPDGIRIRKFSSHGLGTFAATTDRDLNERLMALRPDLPPPHTRVDGKISSSPLGGPMWSYQLWLDFIIATESGHYRNGLSVQHDGNGGIDYRPLGARTLDGWNPPAYHQLTISSWDQFKGLSNEYDGAFDVRPFNFLTVLPPFTGDTLRRRATVDALEVKEASDFLVAYQQAGCPAFFTDYVRNASDIDIAHRQGHIFTRIDGRMVALPSAIPLIRLVEQQNDYFTHAEAKAARPGGAGDVGVRRVRVGGVVVCGKMTNSRALEIATQTDGAIGGADAITGQTFGTDSLAWDGEIRDYARLLKGYARADVVLASGVPARTLDKLKSGKTKTPDPATTAAILSGLALLDPSSPDSILGWRRDVPISVLARALDLPPIEDNYRYIREVRSGRRHLPDNERLAVISAIQAYQRECQETVVPTAAEADARTHLADLYGQDTPTRPPVIPTYTLPEILAREQARMGV